MRIYIRKQYFVCVIYFISLLLTLSLIFVFYFGNFYGTDKCSGFPSFVQKWEICYQIQFFTVWMIRYENYRLNCESFPLTCLKIHNFNFTFWTFSECHRQVVAFVGSCWPTYPEKGHKSKKTRPCSWTTHVDNAILAVRWFTSLLILLNSNET